jgi:predicted nucleic acid-binding protein
LLKIRSGVNVLVPLTFDSEAILAFLFGEPGGDIVRDSLKKIQNGEREGFINIVNLTEIHYILSRINPSVVEEKIRNLHIYHLKIVPVEDNGLWREVAKFKCNYSMSLGNAFAAATAKIFKTKLVVGNDEEFNNIGVELLRIR